MTQNRKHNIKNIAVVLAVSFLAVVFSFAPKAHAQQYFDNNNTSLRNWADNPPGPINSNSASVSGLNQTYCRSQLFSFQTSNLFVGTFCDLGNIVAISAADFAINTTCTIQGVSMTNYDSTISFTSNSSPPYCQANHQGTSSGTSVLGSTSGQDVFGTGSTSQTSGNTGLYASAVSQLSHDITDNNSWIYQGYRIVRNFATVAALIALMIFAFANILHVDINTYTIKKMIPNIIIAVVGGYLAIYAVGIVSRGVDFLYRLEFFSPYNTLHPFYNIMGGNFGSVISSSGGTDQTLSAIKIIFQLGGLLLGGSGTISIISGILGTIFLAIPAVVVFAFEYVLALRPLVVGLLVVLSPVAFAAYVFPTGQNIFRKWATITLVALFYTPAVNLIFYLLHFFPGGTNPIFIVLMLLIKTAVLILLIRLPFTIESDIQKISLALSGSNFGASLGLGKGGQNQVKVKQDNRSTVTDQIFAKSAAKNLIAPISGAYRRELTAANLRTNERRTPLTQMFSRAGEPLIKNLGAVGDKAHKNNLSRGAAILTSSIADLSPQSIHKIVTSSARTIFSDNNMLKELKVKNGQLLDDEGAVTRADATKKVFREAQLVDSGKIASPDAIRLMAQKQMLPSLPVEIIKKSVQEGIITPADLEANFKAPSEKVMNYLAAAHPGRVLNIAELQEQMQKDFYDSKTGFTDLAYALENNLSAPAASSAHPIKVLESIKNQNDFDKNGLYYLRRLGEINTGAKQKLALELKTAGTPEPTAIAISQNPALAFEQISAYVPKTSSTETLTSIKETIAERNTSQSLIKEVASSVKEDKAMLGQRIAEKVSESFKVGTSHSFDDVKNQLSDSLRNLKNGDPNTVKQSLSQINSFSAGTQIQTAGMPTSEDIEKIKNKGEAVISTIDEMKVAGVDEKTVQENPTQAAQKYTSHVEKVINNVTSGNTKPTPPASTPTTSATPIASAGAEDMTQTANIAEENLQAPLTGQSVAGTIGKVIATDAKEGSSFEQKLGDISQTSPDPSGKPAASQNNAAPKLAK